MHIWLASIGAVAHLATARPIVVDGPVVAPKTVTVVTAHASHDTVGAPDSARALPTSSEAMMSIVIASELDHRARLEQPDAHPPRLFGITDSALIDTTSGHRRPRAIEYSEAYHTRLKIHQIGAYLMIPLFIGEYVLGEKLINSTNRSDGLKTAHSTVAAGVGVVFVANTVTGAWNFWDARKDPNGRTRRDVHSALMLASDVGFLLTAASAGNAQHSLSQARTHRTLAISSIALSAIGSGMMWLWKN